MITDRMLRMFKGERAEKTMNDLIHSEYLIEVTYLVATALFILSLKWMSSPTHGPARRAGRRARDAAGDRRHAAAHGDRRLSVDRRGPWCSGSLIGVPLGMVPMTAVPQRTALSHAFGALCVTLVGSGRILPQCIPMCRRSRWRSSRREVILGSLTFTGSLMAAGKLQEVLPQRPITYKGQNFVNLGLLAMAVVAAAFLVREPGAIPCSSRSSSCSRSRSAC